MDAKEGEIAEDHRNLPEGRLEPDNYRKGGSASSIRRVVGGISKDYSELHQL